MKTELKFHGEILDGHFIPDERDAYRKNRKKLEGKKVTVTEIAFVKFKERSNPQNRYLHGVVCKMLSEENGDTPFYWYQYIKVKFVLKKLIGREPDMDKIFAAGKFEEVASMLTTTNMSTVEFMDLIADIRPWASVKFGLNIPDPDRVPFKY